jgi:SAM-dependent methyltransferase
MPAERPHAANYAFILDFLRRHLQDGRGRVLDFGCGDGDLVRDLRRDGFDAFGADVFYEGASFERVSVDGLLADGYIRAIDPSGKLPFADGFFDAVVSHMVIEHVEELEGAVAETHRVLKRGGIAYHQFPTLEVLREGHFGVPLSHRLPAGRLRLSYMVLARRLGLGSFAVGKTPVAWAREALAWLDSYCVYRTRREVEEVFLRRFAIASTPEVDYCRFRAAYTRRTRLKRLLEIGALEPLLRMAFRRLAFATYHLAAVDPLSRSPSAPLAAAAQPPRGTRS